MNPAPKDPELAQLDLLLAAVDRLVPDPDAAQAEIVAQVHRWKHRLQGPVRLAFVGGAGVGKSGLINLLVGEPLLPPSETALPMPVTIVSHGPRDRLVASWWDRPGAEVSGQDLGAALALGPDLLTLESGCEVLEDLTFVEARWPADQRGQKQCLFALSRLADVVFWCADGRDPETWPGPATLGQLPQRLTRNSRLVLTHADGTAGDAQQIEERAAKSTRWRCLPISVPAAMAALQDLPDDFETRWAGSGAEALVQEVAEAAIRFRAAEREKVRAGIAESVAPWLEALRQAFPATFADGGESLVPTSGTEPQEHGAPAPEPAHGHGEEVAQASDSITEQQPQSELAVRAAGILSELQAGTLASNAEVISAVLEAVEAVHESACSETGSPVGDPQKDFDRARDLLTLMQFEADDKAALDAVRILWQLASLPVRL